MSKLSITLRALHNKKAKKYIRNQSPNKYMLKITICIPNSKDWIINYINYLPSHMSLNIVEATSLSKIYHEHAHKEE